MYQIKRVHNKLFTHLPLHENNKGVCSFPRGPAPTPHRRFFLFWKLVFWWPGMPWVNPTSGAWQSLAEMPEGHTKLPQTSWCAICRKVDCFFLPCAKMLVLCEMVRQTHLKNTAHNYIHFYKRFLKFWTKYCIFWPFFLSMCINIK